MIVLPSSLFETRDNSNFDLQKSMDNNMSLRMGIVIKIHEIEDKTNLRKVMPEYDVLAINDDPKQGLNTLIYERCWRVDGFGGMTDFFQAKLRATPKPEELTKKKIDFTQNIGSIVLLLCLDNASEKAIIIGALANPSQKLLNKELGHHLEGEFNGLNWKINKDGELIVTFKAAFNDEGKSIEADKADAEKVGGTNIKIDKTGSFELNVSAKEYIKVDKKDKTIKVNAEKDIAVNTEANTTLTSKENLTISCKDWVANAEGKISFNAKSPSAFNITGALEIKADTVKVDASGGIDMKSAKIEMNGDAVTITSQNVEIKSPMIMLGSGGTPALTSATQFLGTGNVGVPVISTAIGPYSSSVMIGA